MRTLCDLRNSRHHSEELGMTWVGLNDTPYALQQLNRLDLETLKVPMPNVQFE
jgi:hypothetical protein